MSNSFCVGSVLYDAPSLLCLITVAPRGYSNDESRPRIDIIMDQLSKGGT